MKKVMYVASFLSFASSAATASAFNASWRTNINQYDNGCNPQISLSSIEVEVHTSCNTDLSLWSDSGSLEQINHWEHYDTGNFPTVAGFETTNDAKHYFIEIHQAQNGPSALWYHMGSATGPTSFSGWGPSYDMGGEQGYLPSVSAHRIDNDPSGILSGVAVTVHAAGTVALGDNSLWMRAGAVALDGSSIDWFGSLNYDNGDFPSVAIEGFGGRTFAVVEVHGTGADTSTSVPQLNYDYGVLSFTPGSGWGIQWKQWGQYATGVTPSVTICGWSGSTAWPVVEVHGGTNDGLLYYTAGTLNFDSGGNFLNLTWDHSGQYDSGYYPHVACDTSSGGAQGIEVHQGTSFPLNWSDTFTITH